MNSFLQDQFAMGPPCVPEDNTTILLKSPMTALNREETIETAIVNFIQ